MKRKIVYLNSEDFSNLEFHSKEERDRLILASDEKIVYSIGDFIRSFNNETISDLGVMLLVDENNNVIAS